jgi:hypothetical protein
MRHLAEITAIARRITQGAPNPYRKTLALQNYLRSQRNFTYSDQVSGGHGADDILHFLTVSKKGYCEQFAGSMAVLLRSLGIPARVAVGFTPGIVQSRAARSTILKVTTQQAHAWVEVLFPKYGWLAFEPTPYRFNAQTALYAFPQRPAIISGGSDTQTDLCLRPLGNGPFAEPCVPRGSAGRSGGSSVPGGEPKGRNATNNPGTGSDGPSARAFVWFGVLAGAVLIFAGIPAVKMTRRRLMLARAKSPSELVLAAIGVLDEQATDVGLGRGDAETLREYGRRLVGSVQGLDGAMTKLTGLAVRAAYSIDNLSSEQAEEARSAASGAARVIRRSVRVERRILGAYRLRRALLGRWATD